MPATYKVTVHSSLQGVGNEFLNVFGYHDQLALPVAIGELATQFAAVIVPVLAGLMVGGMKITRVETEQVIGGTEYVDTVLAPPASGVRSGDRLPSFNAWGFTLHRATAGKRSGAKRVGMISETDVNLGVASDEMSVILNAAAVSFQSPLQVGLVNTWFPVILERPKLPLTVWGFHDLAGVTYSRVTTQNTRKR
jgi:hypothetical protein